MKPRDMKPGDVLQRADRSFWLVGHVSIVCSQPVRVHDELYMVTTCEISSRDLPDAESSTSPSPAYRKTIWTWGQAGSATLLGFLEGADSGVKGSMGMA